MLFRRLVACTFAAQLALTASASAQLLRRVDGEAVSGQPFGIARITVEAGGDSVNGFNIVEQNGRAMYPTFSSGRVRRVLGELLGSGAAPEARNVTIYFLFTGDAPLQLTCYVPRAQNVSLTPIRDSGRNHQRLLNLWWRDYNASVRQQQSDSDYRPIVQTYLTSMLSSRLGLEPPLLSRVKPSAKTELQETLELITGVEGLRSAILRDSFTTVPAAGPASLPLPPEPDWLDVVPPLDLSEVAVEPMALQVPRECFYIRFGTFANYLWLDRLTTEYGGDLSRMITLRGTSDGGTSRIQKQLGMKMSATAELFGDKVVDDVAIIGRDLFLNEGAAIGVLFKAKIGLLGNDIRGKQLAALKQHPDATKVELPIAGQTVTLVSTPDNRLRSFYASKGNYHLVTTSRDIVERFLAIQDGAGSLGATAEFRQARAEMPLIRDDTIFVYFSTHFQRGLLSPQYQIELARRLQAVTEIETSTLASLAARAEGLPGDDVATLIQAGLLPVSFNQRPDGSRVVSVDGERMDSLRGARGSFLPVPDVTISGVTAEESAVVTRRAQFYGQQWKRLDPLSAAIKRYALNEQGLERIAIDASVSPFDESKYSQLTSMLGPPTRLRVAPGPADIIWGQAVIQGGQNYPGVLPHHLFLGVQDAAPLTQLDSAGFLEKLMIVRSTPAYLGAWPKPGFLDQLPFALGGGPPDIFGYSRLPLGLWRWQAGGFSVLSFDRGVLDYITPQLKVEETADDAQVRLHVGDISQSNLVGWVNALTYDRANRASRGNVRLLNALTSQLRVPVDEAKATAEQLLGAELVCALGGEYKLGTDADGRSLWYSTGWSEAAAAKPYNAVLLDWFRGLDAALTKYGDRLILHTELDMQRKESQPAVELPFFKLFGGNQKKDPVAPPPKKPSGPREL